MFRLVTVVTAIVCLALFAILLLDGRLYVSTYGITPDRGADFLARRAAPLFIGLAVILWLLRDAPAGTTRDAVCYGMAALWMGIAATGVFEYATGQAGFAILVAAAAEVVIALIFLIARTR